MSKYHGYWFYGLRDDIVFQTQDSVEEYYILNCPQEYDGPFKTKHDAQLYRAAHPNKSKEFHQMLKEMEEFYYGEFNLS